MIYTGLLEAWVALIHWFKHSSLPYPRDSLFTFVCNVSIVTFSRGPWTKPTQQKWAYSQVLHWRLSDLITTIQACWPPRYFESRCVTWGKGEPAIASFQKWIKSYTQFYFSLPISCTKSVSSLKTAEFGYQFDLEITFCQVQWQLVYSIVHKSQSIRMHSGKSIT